ncbi:MAG TPA: hypothetical protein VG894_09340 [Bauldia sp.]|nr:hypothetical protein [Bauldia sp.]
MFRVTIAALLTALIATAAAAQAPADGGPPPAAAQPPGPPAQVGGAEISILIRTALVTLNDANVTGNYTVLRDLGASILQVNNTAADLAAQFAEFRKQRINLAGTVLFDPVLDEKPQLSTDGVLHLVGHVPTKPQEVIFDLTFGYEAGAWRLAVIKVGTRMASDAAATGPAPADDSGGSAAAAPMPTPHPRPK